jgi:hypothetical protein
MVCQCHVCVQGGAPNLVQDGDSVYSIRYCRSPIGCVFELSLLNRLFFFPVLRGVAGVLSVSCALCVLLHFCLCPVFIGVLFFPVVDEGCWLLLAQRERCSCLLFFVLTMLLFFLRHFFFCSVMSCIRVLRLPFLGARAHTHTLIFVVTSSFVRLLCKKRTSPTVSKRVRTCCCDKEGSPFSSFKDSKKERKQSVARVHAQKERKKNKRNVLLFS